MTSQRSKAAAAWCGNASSEGGPILVADVDGYATWPGLTPELEAAAYSSGYVDLAPVPMANGQIGLLYEILGAGVADVAAGDGELIVARGWYDDEDGEAEARHFVLQSREAEERSPHELTIFGGFVAVVWMWAAATEVVGDVPEYSIAEVLRDEARGGPTPLGTPWIEGVGCALPIAPGVYQASLGRGEGDGWMVRWVRFVRRENAFR